MNAKTITVGVLAAVASTAAVSSPGAAQPAGTPWSAYVADFADGTVTPINLATNTAGDADRRR